MAMSATLLHANSSQEGSCLTRVPKGRRFPQISSPTPSWALATPSNMLASPAEAAEEPPALRLQQAPPYALHARPSGDQGVARSVF